jgi:nucleotide-binding universal stress UspA family protein
MKILLAVDELERSSDALEWTAAHTHAPDSVTVVNVVPPGASPEGAVAAPGARGGYPGVGAWEGALTHEHVLADAQRRLRERGVEAEVKLVHGDPRTAILAESEAGAYDVIVLGTRDSGLLGTLSSRIAQDAGCRVEIVGKTHLVHIEPRV